MTGMIGHGPTLSMKNKSLTKGETLGEFVMRPIVLATVLSATAFAACAQDVPDWKQAEATEVWTPVPAAVDTPVGNAPSDAVVLFDGTSLKGWRDAKGGDAQWTVADGAMTVSQGGGDIFTREDFCDVQLHVEWRTPVEVMRDGKELMGQGRHNSGVFLQDRYEVQVLDSYRTETYPNGQAGAVYKQSIPLVNASRAPGQWQVYDIIYRAPKFDGAGKVMTPAVITVLHNGVLIQDHFEIKGPTVWIGKPPYEAHGCAPLRLQDHGNPVSFRNIWVRKL